MLKKKASGRKKDKSPNIPFFPQRISRRFIYITFHHRVSSLSLPNFSYIKLLLLSFFQFFVEVRRVDNFEAMAARKEATNVIGMENEVQFAKCECCGLTEEYTKAYIARVRERNEGLWICGLCAEAVKDEMVRSSSERRIGRDEALNRHMTFCKKFRTKSLPPNPTDELISAVKQLMLRSLDSPRSNSMSRGGLVRWQSCFSAIDS